MASGPPMPTRSAPGPRQGGGGRATARQPVDVAIMRGGTSRGPVLRLDAAPPAGPVRDLFARALIGETPVDGLGGGTPITNKVVLVGPGAGGGAQLDYIVGNVSPTGGVVDWSGTCGNMTAAVVPFAAIAGLLGSAPESQQLFRLRNLATGGLVDVTVDEPGGLGADGGEVRLTTAYLDPGGSVLGATLPTGRPREVVDVDGEGVVCTIIDVTHPYLLLDYEQVVGGGSVDDPGLLERIERIRGTVCVMLGLCRDADAARGVSAAVPRVVLVHAKPGSDADVRITAVSMGRAIATVPVTAAMSLAAAHRIDGTLVSGEACDCGDDYDDVVCVAAPAASLEARVRVDSSGRVRSAAVGRTARCVLRGTAWA